MVTGYRNLRTTYSYEIETKIAVVSSISREGTDRPQFEDIHSRNPNMFDDLRISRLIISNDNIILFCKHMENVNKNHH